MHCTLHALPCHPYQHFLVLAKLELERPRTKPESLFPEQTMAVGDLTVADGSQAVLGQQLHTPAAWTAADALANPSEWQYEFTPQDVQELIQATRSAVESGKPVAVRCMGHSLPKGGRCCMPGWPSQVLSNESSCMPAAQLIMSCLPVG